MRRRRTTTLIAGPALAVLVGATLSACGADEDVLQVYAAASLQGTFEALADGFEEEHGIEVRFNFAGSSSLVAQIQEGADADVFASANEENMQKLVDADLVEGEPRLFATNTLTIAVPPGNPADVSSLADLVDPDLNLVVCAPQVPCGDASESVREEAGLDWSPKSEEQSVTDVLNKVTTEEADAGLVYVTDVIGAGDRVESIDFEEASAAVNNYPVAQVKDSARGDLADEFIELLLSEEGRTVLDEAGFALP